MTLRADRPANRISHVILKVGESDVDIEAVTPQAPGFSPNRWYRAQRHLRQAIATATSIALLALSLTWFENAGADTNPATDSHEMSCVATPSATLEGLAQSGVQAVVPGERVQFSLVVPFDEGTIYQDILARPDGSTYYASYLELTQLASDLNADPSTIELRIAPGGAADPIGTGVAQTVVPGTMPDPTNFVLETDTSVAGETGWRMFFPGDEAAMLAAQTGYGEPSHVVPAGGEIFVLTFEAQMPTDAVWGEVYEGAECFVSVSTGPSNRDTDRIVAAVSAILPELDLTKDTPLANAYVAGTIAPYTITATVPEVDFATASLTVATAHDVIVVDTVPVGLSPVNASGVPVADGGTTAGGGIWDLGTRTVTYNLGDIGPGTSVVVEEEMRIDPDVPSTTSLTNTVVATISYLPGNDPDDTVISPADSDDATVTVSSPPPTVEKEASIERYGSDLPFNYTVTVNIPAGASYENFTVSDLLPDGLQFLSYTSAVCLPAGPTCPTAIPTLAPTAFPGAGWGIGWYPNSIPVDTNPRQLVLVYEAQIDPAYGSGDPVEFFDEFENDLNLFWNTVDRLGAVPPSTASLPSYDGQVGTSDTVIYDRPILELDKVVDTSDGVFADTSSANWDFEIGDTATFTIVVTNVGSSDALNIAMTDTPAGFDIDPTTVLIDGAPCTNCGVGVTGMLSFSIPGPVAPGASYTVTYEATPNQNGTLVNLFEIPTYDDPLGSTYNENPSDSTTLVIPDPVLTIDKAKSPDLTVGVANTIGTRFPFVFTVTNISATTAYNVEVTDVPPTGLCNIAGGLDPAATGVTESAPGSFALTNPLAPGASLTFGAELEVCGPVDPGAYDNVAELRWEDLNDGIDGGGSAYFDSDSAPLELVGPQFEIVKGPAVDAGATLNWSADLNENGVIDPSEISGGAWTVTITNPSPAPVGGLVLDDLMPEPFEYLPGTATALWLFQPASSFVDNSTASGTATMAGHTEQVDLTLGQLEPGGEIRVTIPFIHNGDDPPDGDLTRLNTVKVTNPNLPFDPLLHESQGEYTLIPVEKGPSIAKTVDEIGIYPGVETAQGAPGKQLDFSIDITVPTTSALSTFDLWVLDELPDGLKLANEPAVGAVPAAGGWTVTCVSGTCPATEGGTYLGSQPGINGKTELGWFLGDTPPDPAENPSVYRITFRVEIETTYDDGTEVVDGVRDPLINTAKPIFNRDNAVPGGSGNVVAGSPAGFPNQGDYDRVYQKDPAEIDLVTPRLAIEKSVTDDDGNPVTEINAGEEFQYTVTITNVGSGPAFDIDLTDDLAGPENVQFINYDSASISSTPAGVTCSEVPNPSGDPTTHLFCEYPGALAPGAQIVITYDATTVDNDDIYSQFSSQNQDPMIILNEATALEYYEAAGEGGNQYSTGNAVSRLFVFTPLPEIDASCVGGAEILPNAPVGSTVQFWVLAGNGDRYDVNGNPDGDKTLTPYPTEDADGDGYPDAGVGFNPVMRITLQDKFIYQSTQGTGPGWGDPTYATYTPFPDPDLVINNGNGTYTMEWSTSLTDIPHSPDHATEADFKPWYDLLIDVTKTQAGGGSIWFELQLEDAAGDSDRGANVGEYFEYTEKDRHGCPGGPPPRVWKYPDAEDAVVIPAGGTDEFVMYIQVPDEDGLAGSFIDTLPDGLIYAGDLPVTDPLYAVATMDVVPPTWTDDNDGDGDVDLQDYFTSSTTQPNGDTIVQWDPPPLPQGLWNDPNNGGADTRWIIRVPVVAEADPPYPNEFVVNGFMWDTEAFGPRQDTGALLTKGLGEPTIVKRVDQQAGPYGQEFTYTLDVTIPAGFGGKDVFVQDQINQSRNWDVAPYTLQDLGNLHVNATHFPFQNTYTAPTVAAGEYPYAHWLYTPAEMELSDYVSDTCIVGCSSAIDQIDAVPMTPLALSETLTLPLYGLDPYTLSNNGAAGWYLGDIEADPEGQDRLIRLVYTVEAPTIVEQRQRVAEQIPSLFPGGGTDPAFDDSETYWFQELSQVNHTNLAQLRSFGADNAALGIWDGLDDDAWENAASTAWGGEIGGSALLAQDDEYVTVSYPLLTMDKSCQSIGADDGTNPNVTPLGTANVECEIEVSNSSPVDAFGVEVTDDPMTDCVVSSRTYYGVVRYDTVVGNTNHWDPVADNQPNGTGRTDINDPDVVRYPCPSTGITLNHPGLQTTPNSLPASWSLSVGAGQTETIGYQLRIDGWTDMPTNAQDYYNGSWETNGLWQNDARMQPWSDSEAGGTTLGQEIVASDEVMFHDSYLHVSKFPYPPTRDLSVDALPFVNVFNGSSDCSVAALWPYYALPCSYAHNPAAASHTAPQLVGDPFAGDYWMNQRADVYTDPLQPPSRAVTPYSWPMHLRGLPLGHHWYGYSGWTNQGNHYDPATGDKGWWKRPLNDPASWADAFDAVPNTPYTWAIDIRVDGLRRLESIDIADQLPYGWRYVPGSAEIVDGNWHLGWENQGWAENAGILPGYGLIPLPDPVIDPTTESACSAANYDNTGQTMRWDFTRDIPGEDQPWDFQYLDSRERYSDHTSYPDRAFEKGSVDKASWIRIHYDAIPDQMVLECDPDTTSTEKFFMENNVEVTAFKDYDSSLLVDTYEMLAPIPNPLAFEKTPDNDFVSDDTLNEFTYTFTNGLDVPVTDLTFYDTLSSTPVAPLANGGYACGSATAVGGTGFAEPVCTGGLGAQSTTTEWFFSSIAPGETITITMPVVVPVDETNLLVWENSANVTVKEWFDSAMDDEGKITVVNPSPPPVPSKSVTPNPATINDVVEYSVSWTAPAYQVYMDLAYHDQVPDGLTFDSFVGITCTGGCPGSYSPADVTTLSPVVNADGTTDLWWWFGDMPGSTTAHTWTMTYKARVDGAYNDGTLVVDEDALTNTVTGYSNEENLLDDPTGTPDPSNWTTYPPSDPGSTDLDIEEPELELRKTAVPSATPTDSSSTITYTLELENTGELPAYAIDLVDTPNGALENVSLDPTTYAGSVITRGWTLLDPTVGWYVPVIQPGDIAVFTYTAEVIDDFLTTGFGTADNLAEVSAYRARPGLEPEDGDRFYEGDETETAVPLVGPNVIIDKFVGDCTSDFSFATPGQPTLWCLVITNDSSAPAYNAIVGDTLPYKWTYNAGTTTGTGWTPVEPTISTPFMGVEKIEWVLGNLAPGAAIEIQFEATPALDAPLNVTNWAAVETFTSSGDPLPPTVTGARSDDPASAAMGAFALEIAKTSDQQQYPFVSFGGQFDWTVTITNPALLTNNSNLVVTDFLPAPLTLNTWTSADPRVVINTVGAPGAGVGGTQEISWDISDLKAGESIDIVLTVDVPPTVAAMTWHVNDVQVVSTEIEDEVVNQAKVRFFEPASLGDYTWFDTDLDGIQDPGEPPLDGVTVNLLDGNGDQLYFDASTGFFTTDATLGFPPVTMVTGDDPSTPAVEQGWYTFDQLPAGDYQVEFIPPAGYGWTTPNASGNGVDALDSDANPLTGLSQVVTLVDGQHDPTIDAGFVDIADYASASGEIDIEKATVGFDADTPTGPAIAAGDPITWTYVVTNTGYSALFGATVIDDQGVTVDCDIDGDGVFDGTNVIPFLLPNDSVTCEGRGNADAFQYENNASVKAKPALPNPDDCGCDLGDPTTWPEDDKFYEPATDPDGNPVPPATDEDPSHYYGLKGGIDIEKDTIGFDADTLTGPGIAVGDPVKWTYVVTNTSTTALADATVTDDQGVTVSCDIDGDGVLDGTNIIPLILVGDSVTCEGTGLATAGQYENNSSVTGDPVLPDPDTCGCDLDDPDTWPTDPDLYTPAQTVVVDEDGNPVIDPDTGEPKTEDAAPVTDEDPSHYFGIGGSLDIEKDTIGFDADNPIGPGIAVGDTVTWTYEITNNTTAAITNAVVTDDQGVSVNCDVDGNGTLDSTNVIPLILVGASVTCQGTGVATGGQYENTGAVTGQPSAPNPDTCGCDLDDPTTWPDDPDLFDPISTVVVDENGDPVIDPDTGEPLTENAPPADGDDPSHFFGQDGGIDIEKATIGFDADTVTGPGINVGDTVTWTYVVTNTSTTALADATVTDNQGVTVSCDIDGDGALDGTNIIPLILVGASVTCEGTGLATAGQYENNSSVSGDPIVPNPDTCGCDPDDPTTWPNDPDLFDPLQIPVVDENGDPVIDPATGEPLTEDAAPVTDEDPSHYFGIGGSLDIEKDTIGFDADNPIGPGIAVGDTVTWTYQVTNNTSTAITNAVVTDDQGVSVTCDINGDGVLDSTNVIPLLLVGETVTCRGTGIATGGQYQNTGAVTGQPATPDPATCGCELDDPTTWPDDADEYEPVQTVVTDENGDPIIDPATGEPQTEDAPPASADDPSHFFGQDGGIDIEKDTIGFDADTITGPGINVGDTVKWTYVVTNTSTTALAEATVSDDQGVVVDCDIDGDGALDGTNVIPLILVGASVTCEGTGTATGGQYDNNASVTGDPVVPDPTTCGCDPDDPTTWPADPDLFDPLQIPVVDGNGDPVIDPATGEPLTEDAAPVTDEDPSHYFGIGGSLDIEKDTIGFDADTVSGPGIAVGDTVTWTYDITNNTTSAIISAVVTDDQGVSVNCDGDGDGTLDGTNVIPLLLVGASVTCQGTGLATGGQYENTGAVTGQPATPDPDTCGCDLDDPTSWPDDFNLYEPVQTVVVDENGDPVIDPTTGEPLTENAPLADDDDPSHFFGQDGGVDVEKSTIGFDADTVTGPGINVGDTVTWAYVVTNTSTTALADSTVTDSQGVAVNCDIDGDGVLDGTNIIPLLLVGASVTCEGTGLATAGQYENNASVTGNPVLPDPDACGCDLDDPATWPNDPDLYEPLQIPVVDGNGDPVIDPATGEPLTEDAPPVTDDDPSHYFGLGGSLDIEKDTIGFDADTVTGPGIAVGDTVTWTYEITNNSSSAVTDSVVTDDQGVSVNCDIDGDGTLDGTNIIPLILVGASVTCQGTGLATGGQYENTGDVTGQPSTPNPDTCGCDLEDPTTWPDDPDEYDPVQTVVVDENGDPVIDPTTGEPLTEDAPPVTDDDPSHFFGQDGGIDIEKATIGFDADTPTGPGVVVGDTVTWSYVVTNTSTTALANATVTDDQGVTVDCDIDGDGVLDGTNVIPLLLVGASVTCEGTGLATGGQYENNASVTGDPVLPDPDTCGCDLDDPTTWPNDPDLYEPLQIPVVDENGDPVIDPDTGEPLTEDAPPVTGEDPSHYFGYDDNIDIEKSTNGVDADTPPGPGIDTGDTVTWSYIVTNNSPAAMANATVTDDQSVSVECDIDGDGTLDGTNVIPLLVPGASVTCQAFGTAQTGPYMNTGSVIADPVVPDPEICDCDLSDPTTWPEDPTFYDPIQEPVIDPETGEPVLDPETGEPLTEDAPPAEDDDESHYFGSNPGVDVQKATEGQDADATPGPGVPSGAPVTWTYVITNTSDSALAMVTVTDDQNVTIVCEPHGTDLGGDNTIDLLLPNASVTCEASGTAVAGQYRNLASVTGAPVVPDPDTCECDLNDPTTWPDDPTLFDPLLDPATGDPVPPVTDDDPSHYFGVDGGLILEKATNDDDADTAPGPFVPVDTAVTWTYTVTNAGPAALLDVTVSDDQNVAVDCGDGTNVIALLAPGASADCTATGVAVAGQYQNLGSAGGSPAAPDPQTCGCDPNDPTSWPEDPEQFNPLLDPVTGEPVPPVTADDPSHYYGTLVDLAVVKAAPATDVFFNSATWTIQVTNNGPDTALAPIVVTDTLAPGLTYATELGSDPAWSCSVSGQLVTCLYGLDVPPGTQLPDLRLTTDIDAVPGTVIENNVAVASGSIGDPATETTFNNNQTKASIVVPEVPGPLPFTGTTAFRYLPMALMLIVIGAILALVPASTTRRRDETTS